ncbi:MAG TPA: hypothetical protein EYG11_06185, partial [Candidatus Latescibacteria bacterium]|nr:hypothetical protein [Candidatus Latescibacterota bacterium]
MKACRLGVCILWLALAAAGCDRPIPSRSVAAEGRFEIAIPLPKIVVEHVSWVEYLVVADGDTLRGNLTIGNDDIARGSITGIPAGSARLVRLSAFNALGVLTYVGATTVDVAAGQAVGLRIVMKAVLVEDPVVEDPVVEDPVVEDPVVE